MVTDYDWHPNSADRRLKSLIHTATGNVLISRFDYLYKPGGAIKVWTQNQPADTVDPVKEWSIEQDAADQLLGVTVNSPAGGNVTVGRESFRFDLAGNRLGKQSGNMIQSAGFNALNQITSVTGGGQMRFSGNVSEAADVTVQGRNATMLDATHFTAPADVVPGTNNVTVTARDGAGNTRNQTYRVNVASTSNRTFDWDLNGNLLDDDLRQYEWDAENRLTKVTQNGTDYEFVYDGLSRRVGEKVNGTMTRRWVWDGLTIVEERDAGGGNVTRKFCPSGFQTVSGNATANYTYTRDHLGSIREVVGSNGTTVAAYRYSSWGERTTLTESVPSSFSFTGHLHHAATGLVFAPYRAYDPGTGRWVNRDPIKESGGLNLYSYVANKLAAYSDPTGLAPAPRTGPPGYGQGGRWTRHGAGHYTDQKGHDWRWHDGDKDQPGRRHKDHWDVTDKKNKKTRRCPQTGADMGDAIDEERNEEENAPESASGDPTVTPEEVQETAEKSAIAVGAAVVLRIVVGVVIVLSGS